MARINLTNSKTVSKGKTITEILANRDAIFFVSSDQNMLLPDFVDTFNGFVVHLKWILCTPEVDFVDTLLLKTEQRKARTHPVTYKLFDSVLQNRLHYSSSEILTTLPVNIVS